MYATFAGNASPRIVNNDQPERTTRNLQIGRAVMVGVIPVRAAHVVFGNIVNIVAAEAALKKARDVIARRFA